MQRRIRNVKEVRKKMEGMRKLMRISEVRKVTSAGGEVSEVDETMGASKEKVPRHVDWDNIAFGSDNVMSCSEANEIIEEIMTVLISRKLTVKVAKRLLKETISSIDKEFVLEKRK